MGEKEKEREEEMEEERKEDGKGKKNVKEFICGQCDALPFTTTSILAQIAPCRTFLPVSKM